MKFIFIIDFIVGLIKLKIRKRLLLTRKKVRVCFLKKKRQTIEKGGRFCVKSFKVGVVNSLISDF